MHKKRYIIGHIFSVFSTFLAISHLLFIFLYNFIIFYLLFFCREELFSPFKKFVFYFAHCIRIDFLLVQKQKKAGAK